MSKIHRLALASCVVVVGAPLACGGDDETKPVVESYTPDAGADGQGPITGLTADAWTWVPIAGTQCRDGSSTGIGVSLGTSNHLLIFLEGGGTCFSSVSCAANRPSFHDSDFDDQIARPCGGKCGNSGIMDRTVAANPVRDWSYVFIPYCTGDLHAGSNVAEIPGVVGQQVFVGYEDMGFDLERIVPTFSAVDSVLLAGDSAGGFGAALNYPRVAAAFGGVSVSLLDDSGPFMEDPYFPACLQTELRTVWGLDRTIQRACAGGCTSDASYFLDFVKGFVAANPASAFGLSDSAGDEIITQFFGYGADDCGGSAQESASTFTAGLLDIRAQLAADANFGAFIFTGADHTSIQTADFYTRTAPAIDGGPAVLMTDWVAGLIKGGAANAGP